MSRCAKSAGFRDQSEVRYGDFFDLSTSQGSSIFGYVETGMGPVDGEDDDDDEDEDEDDDDDEDEDDEDDDADAVAATDVDRLETDWAVSAACPPDAAACDA
jgi:hypothetical protein